MNIRRIATILASLIVAATVCTACASATTTEGRSTSHTVPVPSRWNTYAYAKAKISVPRNWAVIRDSNCPDASALGTLELGIPKVLSNCTEISPAINTVTLSSLTAGTNYKALSCSPVNVNELLVYVGPCSTSNAPGIIEWFIPTLGVEATGTGSRTVVDRILHTLRRK
jgi:hypothetical protein